MLFRSRLLDAGLVAQARQRGLEPRLLHPELAVLRGALDAFAGGLVLNSLVSLWLMQRFGLSLAAEAEVSLVTTLAAPQRERLFRPARPHGPSEAERAAHAAFLETVKSPLWND